MDIICRLCLKSVQEWQPVDRSLSTMLKNVLLNCDIKNSEGSIVCQNCQKHLENSFRFKMTFIMTEEKLYKSCRICKKYCSTKTILLMNHLRQNAQYLEIFCKYLPEIDLGATKHPVVCESCINSVRSFVAFIDSCSRADFQLDMLSGRNKPISNDAIRSDEHKAHYNIERTQHNEITISTNGTFKIKKNTTVQMINQSSTHSSASVKKKEVLNRVLSPINSCLNGESQLTMALKADSQGSTNTTQLVLQHNYLNTNSQTSNDYMLRTYVEDAASNEKQMLELSNTNSENLNQEAEMNERHKVDLKDSTNSKPLITYNNLLQTNNTGSQIKDDYAPNIFLEDTTFFEKKKLLNDASSSVDPCLNTSAQNIHYSILRTILEDGTSGRKELGIIKNKELNQKTRSSEALEADPSNGELIKTDNYSGTKNINSHSTDSLLRTFLTDSILIEKRKALIKKLLSTNRGLNDITHAMTVINGKKVEELNQATRSIEPLKSDSNPSTNNYHKTNSTRLQFTCNFAPYSISVETEKLPRSISNGIENKQIVSEKSMLKATDNSRKGSTVSKYNKNDLQSTNHMIREFFEKRKDVLSDNTNSKDNARYLLYNKPSDYGFQGEIIEFDDDDPLEQQNIYETILLSSGISQVALSNEIQHGRLMVVTQNAQKTKTSFQENSMLSEASKQQGPEKLICHTCGSEFDERNRFIVHLRFCHELYPERNNEVHFTCKICDLNIQTRYNYNKHMKERHGFCQKAINVAHPEQGVVIKRRRMTKS